MDKQQEKVGGTTCLKELWGLLFPAVAAAGAACRRANAAASQRAQRDCPAALVSAAEHLEITASVNVTVISIVFDSCSLYYLIYIIF